jgi:hypothetical protein
VHASARDLAHYLRFQLGDGTWEGKRLISEENLAEPHTPQVVVRREGYARLMNPYTNQISYGMGWVVQDYRGQHLILHGGAIDGFRAHLTLVPKAKLGIALLNNLHATQLNMALSQQLVDSVLGLPHKDWNTLYQEIQKKEEADVQAVTDWRKERPKGARPPRALNAYAGIYEDAAYGTVRVELVGGGLVWRWNSQRCALEHFREDLFVTTGDDAGEYTVQFVSTPNGRIRGLQAYDRYFAKEK